MIWKRSAVENLYANLTIEIDISFWFFIQKQQTFDRNNEIPNRMKVPYTHLPTHFPGVVCCFFFFSLSLIVTSLWLFYAFTVSRIYHNKTRTNNFHRVRLFCDFFGQIHCCDRFGCVFFFFYPHLNNEEGKLRNWWPYEKNKKKKKNPFQFALFLF